MKKLFIQHMHNSCYVEEQQNEQRKKTKKVERTYMSSKKTATIAMFMVYTKTEDGIDKDNLPTNSSWFKIFKKYLYY